MLSTELPESAVRQRVLLLGQLKHGRALHGRAQNQIKVKEKFYSSSVDRIRRRRRRRFVVKATPREAREKRHLSGR